MINDKYVLGSRRKNKKENEPTENNSIKSNELIELNTKSKHNNALFYLPRLRSNYDLVNNDYDVIKKKLIQGCIYLPNLVAPNDNFSLFDKIKSELGEKNEIINWSKHYKIENPDMSPTFVKIINTLSAFFNVKVLQTRLNYYTCKDYKPYHHNSHAYTNGI
jgi:hypothetical protein